MTTQITPSITATIKEPVLPAFQLRFDGEPKHGQGRLTLGIVTADNEINIGFDSDDHDYLTKLGNAITQAGGVMAWGELTWDRTERDGALSECNHFMEAETIAPWSPEEAGRFCETCKTGPLREGYVLDGGYAYYCNDHQPEGWDKLHDDDPDENYWTQWEDDE